MGERLRYRVHSEARPQNVYLVDLLANGGQGECTCKDWSCRCWPIVREGGKARCKHITAARAHFLDHLLATMAAIEGEALQPSNAGGVADSQRGGLRGQR